MIFCCFTAEMLRLRLFRRLGIKQMALRCIRVRCNLPIAFVLFTVGITYPIFFTTASTLSPSPAASLPPLLAARAPTRPTSPTRAASTRWRRRWAAGPRRRRRRRRRPRPSRRAPWPTPRACAAPCGGCGWTWRRRSGSGGCGSRSGRAGLPSGGGSKMFTTEAADGTTDFSSWRTDNN